MDLSIVIPAYLEEENLRILLPRLLDVLPRLGASFEVLIIDTCPPKDKTSEVCAQWKVTHIPREGGAFYGDAVRTGIRYSSGDWVLFMDADGSHTPEFLPSLWAYRHDYHVVIASRYTEGGETENPRYLIWMSLVLNVAYSWVLGLKCKDVSNSFKLYRGKDLRDLTLHCKNFDIVEEILVKIGGSTTKLRIKEVPFVFKKRMFGNTKRNLFAFILSFYVTLARLFWARILNRLHARWKFNLTFKLRNGSMKYPGMNLETDRFSSEVFLKSFYGFLIGACIVTIIGFCMAAFLPADPTPLKTEVIRLFIHGAAFVAPEPTEKMIFLTSTFISLLFFFFWHLRLGLAFSQRRFSWATNAFVFFMFLSIVILSASQIIRRVFGGQSVTSFLTLGSLVLGWVLFKPHQEFLFKVVNGRSFRRAVLIVGILLASYITLTWKWFGLSTVNESGIFSFHFSAAFYGVTQSVAGKVPLVDFTSLYGYFGELLAPWFREIGFSVSSFTATMAILQVISLAAVFWFSYQVIVDGWLYLALVPSLLMVAQNWLVVTNELDPYFQYWPVRFLFPALSLPLYYFWQKRGHWSIWCLVSFLSGVSLLWNLDTGVTVTGTFLAIAFFEELVHAKNTPFWIQRVTRFALRAGSLIALVAMVIFLFLLQIRLRSGGWPDPWEFVRFQRVFYSAGYYMLPLPLTLHPWMVLVCLYLMGLSTSIVAAVQADQLTGEWATKVRHKAGQVFFLTILGIGIFPYYQGRSHDYVFTAVLWPAVTLFFLLVSLLVRMCRVNPANPCMSRLKWLPLILCSWVGFSSAFSLGILTPKLWKVSETFRSTVSTDIVDNSRFISNEMKGEKECAILSRLQAVYFAESKLASSLSGPGVDEGQLILKSDLDAINKQLSLALPEHLFIESYWLPSSVDSPFQEGLRGLNDHYKLVGSSPNGKIHHYLSRAPSSLTE